MTAPELLAKQTKQLRIDRLVQADNAAKRRDFDDRYGNARKYPKGVVRKVYKRKPQEPLSLHSALLDLGKGFCRELWHLVSL